MTRAELLQIAKPILFNTEMVKAILEGRKTVTRRVIKPQPKMKLCYAFAGYDHGKWHYPDKNAWKYWGEEFKILDNIENDELKRAWTPPCHTDDIRYVRETWGHGYDNGYIYKADDKLADLPLFQNSTKLIYRPSIHMPKEAARIFLRVTDVRVERLQEITDEQAEKEGCSDYTSTTSGFCYIWDSTIKKSDLDRYGWDANPWVWAIEFERVKAE